MTNQAEIWQVDAGGTIYEAPFNELGEWIAEGSLLPHDRVRRGNLRWLEAGKIPLLFGFFNAKELGLPMPATQGETKTSNSEIEIPIENENVISPTVDFVQTETKTDLPEQVKEDFVAQNHYKTDHAFITQPPQNFSANNSTCHVHPELSPDYVCDGCANSFCKACPKSFGGTVKICPLCGALCKPLKEVLDKQKTQYKRQSVAGEGFGFADIGRAIAFPFRYTTSFIVGSVMFMFFTVGQSASAFGGIFMIWAAIVCAMLANTLSFGILANTVENFSKGETERNFMPDFEDFNLWDDVIHPFFLSIAVYVVSFGLLIFLSIGAILFTLKSVSSQPSLQQQTISQVKETTNSQAKTLRFENGQLVEVKNGSNSRFDGTLQVEDEAQMERLMQENRKVQMESMLGKSSEQRSEDYAQAFQKLGVLIIPILLLGFIGILWGLFYFPAACAVAGYTRSISETLNPTVGLDTIKRLGFDYVKILAVFVSIVIVSAVISTILNFILSPLSIPKMGNLPAAAIFSLLTFYFTIVFSATLGFALFKNSEKLNL